MNRMGVPQPDYTPDGVLAEIARVSSHFSKVPCGKNSATTASSGPSQEGCTGTEILHTETFKRGLGKFRGWSLVPRSTPG